MYTILKKQHFIISAMFIFPMNIYAQADKDLINGKLAPCPNKPNCLSTEINDLPPISIKDTEQAWTVLQNVINELGGTVKKSRSDYLWATFETDLIKFTDDVEARLDVKNKLIHLRSASRTGYYDFNANKKRLKKIIRTVNSKLSVK